MSTENQSPVTVSTEQATVQATGMESINNGMTPQGSATPDSDSSAKEKELRAQQLASSVQIRMGKSLQS